MGFLVIEESVPGPSCESPGQLGFPSTQHSCYAASGANGANDFLGIGHSVVGLPP